MRLAILMLVCALVSPAALAVERSHTVATGESASAIAKRYYGDYDLAELLLRFNGRQGDVIRPGETLRVPYCEVHRVKSGDSWSKLAQHYLRRPAAWPVIAELNGLPPERALQIDQQIVMPVVLEHTLQRGESLAGLAALFYHDAGRGRMLREFNGIDDPRRLSVGQVVEVPLLTLRPREVPAPPPAPVVAEQTPPEPAPREPRFTAELAEVRETLEAGDYGDVLERLGALRKAVVENGAARDLEALWRLTAFAHVAFDDAEAACDAWSSLLTVDPAPALDPDRVSPKIRTALSSCGPA